MSIHTVGIVGAGTMGNGIAQACAVSGISVVMVDINQAAVDKGLATIGKSLDRLLQKEKITEADKAAALGRVQLARLPVFLERRQQLAARYLRELKDLPLVLPADAPAGDAHAWHLFVLRLSDDATVTRDEVIQALSDAGIATSVHYVPLHRQPYWRDRYGLTPEQFPVAEAAYQRMFSVPLFTAMSDGEQARVIAALKDIVR